MDRKQYSLTVLLALVAGLLGGVISSQLFSGQPALAGKFSFLQDVVSAEEFVLLSKKPGKQPWADLKTEEGKLRLALYDKEGYRRAILGLDSNGMPALSFWDKDSTPRMILQLHNEEPALDLITQDEGRIFIGKPTSHTGPVISIEKKGSIQLAVDGKGSNHILFKNEAGKNPIFLSMSSFGPSLLLVGKDNTSSVLLHTVTSKGDTQPTLSLSDSSGKTRLMLGLRSNQRPRLTMSDSMGKSRARLQLRPDGGPELQFITSEEKLAAILALTPNEHPAIGFYDKNAELIWKAP